MSERLNRIVTILNNAPGDVQKAAIDVFVTSNLVSPDTSLPIPSVRFDENTSLQQWGIEGDMSSGITVTIHPHDIEEYTTRLGPKYVAKMAHGIIKARRQEGRREIPLPEALDTTKVQLGFQLMVKASVEVLLDLMPCVDGDAVILEILRAAINQAHLRTQQELHDAKRNLYFAEFSGE